jgi:hypothetical protein
MDVDLGKIFIPKPKLNQTLPSNFPLPHHKIRIATIKFQVGDKVKTGDALFHYGLYFPQLKQSKKRRLDDDDDLPEGWEWNKDTWLSLNAPFEGTITQWNIKDKDLLTGEMMK